ncbi:MAG: twin-arginine translocase TatA/TatE family subunit [Desulfobacteraceae bacterium]|nr:twin-arginine translocase TatA/TatE family subunit [Desulfobacteraceae bacterium]
MFEGLFQPMHLLVILAIVLIIFGPGKLPELGSGLGKGIKEFKKSMRGDEPSSPSIEHNEEKKA